MFDKTKLPKATSQYKDKDGKVIVDAGERYQNWGQFAHHTCKGIHIINKLRHLADVIEREHLEGQLISGITSLPDDMRLEDDNDDRDFKSLKEDYGDELLLQKLQDVGLDVTNGFRSLTAALHAKCRRDNRHISDLDSLDDYPFTTVGTNGVDHATTIKHYNHLASKYEDDVLLEKMKAEYDRKCKETRVLELHLQPDDKGFGFMPTIPGEENPFVKKVVDGSVADNAGVEVGMEIKSINDCDVEGIGKPAQQVTDKVKEAMKDGYLKLVVFKYIGYRKVK